MVNINIFIFFKVMKKTLVEMELDSYDCDYGTLVVRPAGVEPKYEADEFGSEREVDKDYPRIPVTKALRDESEREKLLKGGTVRSSLHTQPNPTRIEFGIETFENKSFCFLSMRINQECQRWFLNIWSMSGKCKKNVIYTSQDIEGVLDTLKQYLVDNDLNLVAINDFIEKLTTNENLQFIEMVTAQPKKKQKEAPKNGYRELQCVEDCEELRNSLIGWLGNNVADVAPQFIEDFNEALNTSEDMNDVYAVVDRWMQPKETVFFREMERLLEWVNSEYDPRCLTDEAIRCINGGLDELAKEAIQKGVKSVGNDHIGGYYLKNTPENEHKFIVDFLKLTDDMIDFIDDCGLEPFIQNFNSVLVKLGYRFDEMVDVSHGCKYPEHTPEVKLTFVIEDINPKKAV